MNMMATSTQRDGAAKVSDSAHAAAVEVITYDSSYGEYLSVVTKNIRDVEAILAQAELHQRKTPLTLLTEL